MLHYVGGGGIWFFVSAIPLKPLNKFCKKFLVMKDILYRCAYLHGIFIWFFLEGGVCPLFDHNYIYYWNCFLAQLLWNRSTKSRETLKLCRTYCVDAQNCREYFHSGFILGIMPLLNLEIWPKLNIQLKQFVSATSLNALNRISCSFI